MINLGWEQEPLLDRLHDGGYDLYGIHYNAAYYRVPAFKDVLISDLRDLERILAFARKIKPDGVISDQCDYSYFAQSLIAEELSLPGPRIREAQLATNKYLQRVTAREQGINSPRFQLCTSVEDVYSFADETGFPVITKPVDNRGSFGVNRIDSRIDIEHAYRDALIHAHSRLVVVEQFIEGRHITVDGYAFQGIGPRALALATKKKLADKKSIIDGEIIYPGELNPDLYNATTATAEDVARKMGFRFGFFHGEFIIDAKNQIYLTEIANRGGGVYTSEVIVPYCCGLDILDIYIRDVMGDSVKLKDLRIEKKPVLMKFFSFPNLLGKTVKNIKGLKDVKQDDNVLKIRVLLQKGTKVPSIQSGASRHGVIIIKAAAVDRLQTNLESALSKIRVEHE